MKCTFDKETAARIHEMLETLAAEPSFDTFEASQNYHCFPDLCGLLNVDMANYSSYGDLFFDLMDAAIIAGIDVTDIPDNLDDPDRLS